MDHKCVLHPPYSALFKSPLTQSWRQLGDRVRTQGRKRGVWRKRLDNRSDNYQFTEFERVTPAIRKEGTIKGNSIMAGDILHLHLSSKTKDHESLNWFRQAVSACEISLVWRAYSLTRFSFLGGQLTDLNVKAASEAMTLFGSSRSIPNDLRKTGGKTSQTGGGGKRGETGTCERSMTHPGFFKLIEGLPLLLTTQALFLLVQREIRARLWVVRVCRALKYKINLFKSRLQAKSIITFGSLLNSFETSTVTTLPCDFVILS